jgi:site-specific recombinase XerD
MTEPALLGPWVRRFLLEHLVAERNLAPNTQRSYRDTLRLLLPFAARSVRKGIDRLRVEDLSAARVRAFLTFATPAGRDQQSSRTPTCQL